MGAKVTDPALLAELETPEPRKVTDPALLAELDGTAPEGPGRVMSGVRGGVEAIPFGQKISALGTSGILKLVKALSSNPAYQDMDTSYDSALKQEREQQALAEQAHPGYNLAGKVIGGGAAMMAAPAVATAAPEAGLLGKMAAGGINSGVFGALHGLGQGDGLQDSLRRAADEGKTYAAFGALSEPVAEVVGSVAQKVGGALRGSGINSARRVLTNGADSLSKRAAVSEPAVVEALDSGAIKAFGTNKGALKRLEGLTEAQGAKYADILAGLEQQGVKGPDAERLAYDLLQKSMDVAPNTMNAAIPEIYATEAEKVLGKAGPKGSLGLTQTENLKRSLQQMAKYGRVEETPLNEVRRDIASQFRQATEDAVDEAAAAAPQGSAVRELADEFVPTKERLGRLIEARNAAERGAARGAQRSHFGLGDSMMMAGGLASGHPGAAAEGIAAALGHSLLKNRGTSAYASAAYGLGNRLLKLDPELMRELAIGGYLGGKDRPPAPMQPAPEDDQQRALIAALRAAQESK